MINAEKYKDEITAIVNDSDYFAIDIDNPSVVRPCGGLECKNCVFNNNDYNDCNFLRMNWLLSEYKEPIKVSRLEYEILEHILKHTEYRYIVRDYMGKIFVHTHEPSKDLVGGFWGVGEGTYENASFLKDLFRFVKWTDDNPTSIKYILDNCVVKEN